ncbi:MarR family winged helix-turn-helix transcriptional regulator [Stenotrophomonas sp. 24(2023)]|uniref:MarR family winged helix-turn-helix transcriptional regulator n=1 Tax=Stenotrophomonas sp. 24(2023) TaxID=3068324 RepID=UPI0027DF4C1B|nr:MarR family winged helix-turn-helix transcriptional regulator [Stenotrophomonas sp. 24(2023)]WMJ68448.1 MarR family winged helix-turn-helix transcriptional regulator [Stenotrophomonas sp. 24(2023)]
MTEPTSPCTCFQLRRAARRSTQLYDQHLAAAGLSLNAYSILRRARQPRPLGELAQALGMDRTTLTRNLKPLLAEGLLEQLPGPHDARQREVRLTADGQARLRRARPLWRRAQAAFEARFGERDNQHLLQLLERLEQRLAGVADA